MRKVWIIAVREYNAAVRTKAFLISVVLMPIFMFGSIAVQRVVKDKVDTTDKKLVVIDRTNQLVGSIELAAKARNESELHDLESGKKVKPAFIIERIAPNSTDSDQLRLELSDRIRDRDLFAFLEIGEDVITAGPASENELELLPLSNRIVYHGESAALDEMRSWLRRVLNGQIRSIRLAKADLDAATVDRLIRQVRVEPHGLISLEAGEFKSQGKRSQAQIIIVPIILMFLMFMMIMVGAQPLIHSVLEEKMQRIAEVLLGSVSPFQIMFGKLLGTVGVSLSMLLLYVAGGIVVARKVGSSEYIPYDLIPWLVIYLTSAIFMFGAMFIAVGAACSDIKEATAMVTPLNIVVMIPLFIWFHVVKDPLSSLSTWLSLFPTCTPLLMLLRQATPVTIPAWQPWVGLAGVIVFTIVCVWAAGRIFRVGLLMQGKPPKITDLMRWAIRG